jgi:hypothetical protein
MQMRIKNASDPLLPLTARYAPSAHCRSSGDEDEDQRALDLPQQEPSRGRQSTGGCPERNQQLARIVAPVRLRSAALAHAPDPAIVK